MAFKVNYKGLDVICETVDDVDSLAERYNREGGKKQPLLVENNTESPGLLDLAGETGSGLETLMQSFGANAKRLLKVVASAGRALSDDEIAEQMDVQKSSVAGYISDIVLKSQKISYDYSTFFVRQLVSDKQGEREHSTEVPQNMREKVLQALSA